MPLSYTSKPVGDFFVIGMLQRDLPAISKAQAGMVKVENNPEGQPVAFLEGKSRGPSKILVTADRKMTQWEEGVVEYQGSLVDLGPEWVKAFKSESDRLVSTVANPRMVYVGWVENYSFSSKTSGILPAATFVHRDDIAPIDTRKGDSRFCCEELIDAPFREAAMKIAIRRGLTVKIAGDGFYLRIPKAGFSGEEWTEIGYRPVAKARSTWAAKIIHEMPVGYAEMIDGVSFVARGVILDVPKTQTELENAGVDVDDISRGEFSFFETDGIMMATRLRLSDPVKFAEFAKDPAIARLVAGSALVATFSLSNELRFSRSDFNELEFIKPARVVYDNATNGFGILLSADIGSSSNTPFRFTGHSPIRFNAGFIAGKSWMVRKEDMAQHFIGIREAKLSRAICDDEPNFTVFAWDSNRGLFDVSRQMIARSSFEAALPKKMAKKNRRDLRKKTEAAVVAKHGRLPQGFNGAIHKMEDADLAIEIEDEAKRTGMPTESQFFDQMKVLVGNMKFVTEKDFSILRPVAQRVHHPCSQDVYFRGVTTAAAHLLAHPEIVLDGIASGLTSLVARIASNEDALRRLRISGLFGV